MPPSSQARTAEERKYINVFFIHSPLDCKMWIFYWVFISESQMIESVDFPQEQSDYGINDPSVGFPQEQLDIGH